MGADNDNQVLDWELSEEYYKENEGKSELRLEDFMEDEITETNSTGDTSALGAEVQRVASEVRRVKDLARQGKTVAEIASLMGVEQKYVSDIQICVQSFPEDHDIAVAHLILMG